MYNFCNRLGLIYTLLSIFITHMKKWLTGIAILLPLLIGLIYIMIPRTVPVSMIRTVNCNVNGGFKFLGDGANWIKWWPGKEEGGKLPLADHGYRCEG